MKGFIGSRGLHIWASVIALANVSVCTVSLYYTEDVRVVWDFGDSSLYSFTSTEVEFVDGVTEVIKGEVILVR